MTRETKIGLLVGLGFVIVIGILLTNHITDRNEPTPANLAQGGTNVRGATAVPGAAVTPPPVTIVPTSPPPHAAVPTNELPPSPPPAIVIGPGATPHSTPPSSPSMTTPPVTVSPVATATPPLPTPPAEVAGADGSERRTVPGTNRLIEIGRLNGAEIVPTGSAGATRTTETHGMEIEAKPGDTLSRLAGRHMGGNTKANRDAIVKVNASLAANPDRIIAGQMYLIPVAAPSTATPATPNPALTVVSAPARPAADSASYTVKAGDTLWSIAREKCGSPSAVEKIKELNKDKIGVNDTIRAGTKLKLPPTAVATIN